MVTSVIFIQIEHISAAMNSIVTGYFI